MATAPLRSGSAESRSSWRVPGNPPWYSVGPWPAILGWTSSLYSSIRSSRSSSVASLPLPRRTPARSEERRVGKECRSLCDWSSDVCSSDLAVAGDPGMDEQLVLVDQVQPVELGRELAASEEDPGQIGRASCRERV